MLWDEPRPPGAPVRVWRDWVLLGALAPAAFLEATLRTDLPDAPVEVVLALVLMPTLLWRRSRPMLMLLITFVPTAVVPLVIGHEPELTTLAYLLILPYAVFRWGSGSEVLAGAVLVVVKIGLHAAFGFLSVLEAVLGLVVMFAAFALANAYRYRARLRSRELDQAKLLERERLARDLHDTVAHHVSAMAIRAQAGIAVAEATQRLDAAVDALRVIENEATRALTEMRTMVHALRRVQEARRAPSPGIADLPGLAGRSQPGPVVDVHLAGDLDDIPETVGTAVYRLAQESVTNARRHARHATRIEVHVAAEARSVRLRVSDDGDTGGIRAAATGGYGLAGMAERAALLGGSCEAGPGPDRGWTVTAALPRTGAG